MSILFVWEHVDQVQTALYVRIPLISFSSGKKLTFIIDETWFKYRTFTQWRDFSRNLFICVFF